MKGEAGGPSANRLRRNPMLRHDWMIVSNEARSAFSSWTDRLTALAVVAITLAAPRAFLSDQSFITAASAVGAFAALIGAGAARIVQHRLAFHAREGALAAEALSREASRRYILCAHALLLAIVATGALVSRLDMLPLALAGYIAGAGIGHAVAALLPGLAPRRLPSLRAWSVLLQRPIAGALAALAFLLLLLPARTLDPGSAAALAGVAAAGAALALTAVDDDIVRFMTLSGYGGASILWRRARPLLLFLLLTVPACLLLAQRPAALIVAGIGLVALTLMAARILAYRIYSRRVADTLVGIGLVVALVAGFMAPLLLPLFFLLLLRHLCRRSASATWLLA
jgi:hypothetical protein